MFVTFKCKKIWDYRSDVMQIWDAGLEFFSFSASTFYILPGQEKSSGQTREYTESWQSSRSWNSQLRPQVYEEAEGFPIFVETPVNHNHVSEPRLHERNAPGCYQPQIKNHQQVIGCRFRLLHRFFHQEIFLISCHFLE